MEIFFELLKYTIPSVVVFATAYFLLKMLLDERQRIDRAIQQREAMKITLPLRLQAYERMMLVCDRAAIDHTLLRIRVPGMTVRELRGALMLAVSQEFDHNTSQQLYVSETLWQIISLAKNDTLALVSSTAPALAPDADDGQLVTALFQVLDQLDATPLQKAAIAVRTEASQLF
jgi:hypothetical protein